MSVLKFDQPHNAEQALNMLRRLQSQQLITILDAAVVAVPDRVIPEIKTLNPELLATNLSREQETRLRELFAESQPVA
jgi:uncharacterized membrane protein